MLQPEQHVVEAQHFHMMNTVLVPLYSGIAVAMRRVWMAMTCLYFVQMDGHLVTGSTVFSVL
jgi:hypothetical protein